jgi:hypothetical protein
VDIHAANIKYYGYKTAAAMQASKWEW